MLLLFVCLFEYPELCGQVPGTTPPHTSFSVGKVFVLLDAVHYFLSFLSASQGIARNTNRPPYYSLRSPVGKLFSSDYLRSEVTLGHSSSSNQVQRHQAHSLVRAVFLPCLLLVLPLQTPLNDGKPNSTKPLGAVRGPRNRTPLKTTHTRD